MPFLLPLHLSIFAFLSCFFSFISIFSFLSSLVFLSFLVFLPLSNSLFSAAVSLSLLLLSSLQVQCLIAHHEHNDDFLSGNQRANGRSREKKRSRTEPYIKVLPSSLSLFASFPSLPAHSIECKAMFHVPSALHSSLWEFLP